jgi:nuclear pore complex protein Nup155
MKTCKQILTHSISPAYIGVFREMVEWCLVVTTKEEAMLCALARKKDQALSLIRTKFVIPSDYISFISITSTKAGRIFLGGQDGNLYELDYDLLVQAHYAASDASQTRHELDKFYDGSSGSCPEVLVEKLPSTSLISTGKRVLDSFMASSKQPPRKCQRLNHSKSTFSSFLPDFIDRITKSILGSYTTTGGGPITQMVVDHEREVLYTLSSRGWICALDIAEAPKVTLAAVLDTASTARLYLEAVSRGKMYAPPT